MWVDLPRALLVGAVRWLPPGKADWGTAMVAELDRVEGRRDRWRFALGCVRAALTAAAGAMRFWPARALGIATGAGAVGAVIYLASSQLLVFAVVFATELAVCGLLATVRMRGVGARRPAASGWAMRLGLLAGVAGTVALSVYGVVQYPAAGNDPAHLYAIVFATVLTGYVWLALAPPPSTAETASVRYGLIGAAALACVWGLGLTTAVLFGYDVLSGYVLAGALLAFAGVGILAGRSTGRIEVGAATGLWSGLAGAVTLFVIGMAGTFATIGDASRDRATYAVSDNLGGLIVLLVLLPIVGPSLTMLGSLLGASRRATGETGPARQP